MERELYHRIEIVNLSGMLHNILQHLFFLNGCQMSLYYDDAKSHQLKPSMNIICYNVKNIVIGKYHIVVYGVYLKR